MISTKTLSSELSWNDLRFQSALQSNTETELYLCEWEPKYNTTLTIETHAINDSTLNVSLANLTIWHKAIGY